MAFITVSFAVFRAPDMPHAFNIMASWGNFTAPGHALDGYLPHRHPSAAFCVCRFLAGERAG